MAITSAIMQMRRGEEEYFDPDKMHPGEWAVSTDTKYVRMCFSPGVCVRMATYEAFEEDMEQIIAILEEAKTVQEAIEKIYEEFQKAELDIEAAENSATLSESYAHGGTGTREGEDTDNAKYYAEKAKENVEPAINAVSDIALNRQTLGYVKKNLLKNTATTQTIRGVTFTVNNDGSITVNGTSDKSASGSYFELDAEFVPPKTGKYILSGCPSGGSSTTFYLALYDNTTLSTIVREVGLSKDIELDITHTYKPTISVLSGTTVENLKFYPMIRSADITDDTFEPYVDDVDTRLKSLTPVNNLLATVPGSPLDAVIGKMLNDMIVALKDSFVVYPVSLINGWNGALFVSINKINRQATITGYIDGTNATSVTFAKGRTYVSQLEPTLSYMPIPVQGTAYTAIDFNTELHRITFSAGNDGIWDVKVPSTGKIYQFNASVIVAYD